MNKDEFRRFPLTYTIIAINIFIFIITALLSTDIVTMTNEVLLSMGALNARLILGYDEWWRLFTAMFLHGGMTHILMNMFSLYLVGRGVELYFEKKAYLSIYLFSGLIGGLASLYMHPNIHPLSVGIGASGAIFGVFGALAGFFLAHRDKIATQSKAFMKDFAMVLGLNLVLGFSIPGIDVSAHVGGLIAGVIGGFVISKNTAWIWAYSVVMFAIVVGVLRYLPHYYASLFA